MVSWRYVLILLVTLGVFAAGHILAVVFWLTARLTIIEQDNSQTLVRAQLDETLTHLIQSVEDYAYRTLAYNVVVSGNRKATFEHLGSGAADSPLFDEMLILNAEGELLYAYGPPDVTDPAARFDQESLKNYVAALRETAPNDYMSIQGLTELQAERGPIPSTISLAWITPSQTQDWALKDAPILVGTAHLDEGWFTRTTRGAGLSGYQYVPGVDIASELDTVVLRERDGRRMGSLTWIAPNTGARLRAEVMPGITLVCVSLLAICLMAARYFQQQSTRLSRATKIASTDQLTGLLNRAGLDRVLRDSALEEALTAGQVAVVYLDLNAFKQLNDTHGHQAGDMALKVMAARLQNAVRKSDYVVRLGGDEFICVVIDTNPKEAAQTVSDRLLAQMEIPVTFTGHVETLRTSIGVAISSAELKWDTVLARADAAMYWAKTRKSPTPVFYSKKVQDAEAR